MVPSASNTSTFDDAKSVRTHQCVCVCVSAVALTKWAGAKDHDVQLLQHPTAAAAAAATAPDETFVQI